MGFPIKYETEEECLAAIRQSKNDYSDKPFTCSHCRVTILLGNEHKHKNTKKHRGSVAVNVLMNGNVRISLTSPVSEVDFAVILLFLTNDKYN